MDPLLLGAELHGFNTLMELQVSLTFAFDERRLLSNEETTAMLLNPHIFRMNGPLVDGNFLIDCYFFIASPDEYEDMLLEAGAMAFLENRWHYYSIGGPLLIGDLKEEYFVGIKKNNPANRRLDFNEIVSDRYEVKGKWRLGRRSVLPRNFADIAGYANPYPGLMVIQYQPCPDERKDNRVARAAELELEADNLRASPGGGVYFVV